MKAILVSLVFCIPLIHGYKYAITAWYESSFDCTNNNPDDQTVWTFIPTLASNPLKTCTWYEFGTNMQGIEYINESFVLVSTECADDECSLSCGSSIYHRVGDCAYGSSQSKFYGWLDDEEEFFFPNIYWYQWQKVYNASNNCEEDQLKYTDVTQNGLCDELTCVSDETIRCTDGQDWPRPAPEDCVPCFPSYGCNCTDNRVTLVADGGAICFGEDSILKNGKGEETKLKDLKIGDMIMTFNSETNKVEEDEILEILFHKNPGNIREIHYRVIDGKGEEGTLSISENHHMYFCEDCKDVNEIARSERKESGDLKLGDRIVVKLDNEEGLHVGEVIGFTKSDVTKEVGVFFMKNNEQVFVDDVLVSVYSRTSVKFASVEIIFQKIWMSVIKLSRIFFNAESLIERALRSTMMFLVEDVYQKLF